MTRGWFPGPAPWSGDVIGVLRPKSRTGAYAGKATGMRMKNGKTKRRQHSAPFKAKAALEVLKGERPLDELAGQFEVHPTLAVRWQ